jgi:hypothetical protein
MSVDSGYCGDGEQKNFLYNAFERETISPISSVEEGI